MDNEEIVGDEETDSKEEEELEDARMAVARKTKNKLIIFGWK